MARTQKSASPGSTITLGSYTFRLQVDDTTGGPAMEVTATCYNAETGKYATATKQFDTGSKVLSWEIEAGDTEASVYVMVQGGNSSDIPLPIPASGSGRMVRQDQTFHTTTVSGGVLTYSSNSVGTDIWHFMAAAAEQGATVTRTTSGGNSTTYGLYSQYTYKEQTVYYTVVNGNYYGSDIVSVSPSYDGPLNGESAWLMIYGDQSKVYDKLIGRFSIDLGDAGGYPGGGGNWDVPGDWNPIPTTTLHLTVNGALSGRHSDPLADPSYSYVPADNTAEAGYGCGGDGGHGGGGGGGASTSIVRQFATNKANSKVIVVTVKRHGYGSGGSKGAKGGDGCILIYY